MIVSIKQIGEHGSRADGPVPETGEGVSGWTSSSENGGCMKAAENESKQGAASNLKCNTLLQVRCPDAEQNLVPTTSARRAHDDSEHQRIAASKMLLVLTRCLT